MLTHTDKYLDKCQTLGILTTEKLHKYPLLPLNLVCVLKAYAICASLPYTIDTLNLDRLDLASYYLTDTGLEWLFTVFREHSISYLRSVFPGIFAKVTEDVLQSNKLEERFKNFRGVSGVLPKVGGNPRALLVCSFAKPEKRIPFSTLADARAEVVRLSRFYMLEDMKLYRIEYEKRKDKIIKRLRPELLVLPPSKRGLVNGFTGGNKL